MAIRKRLLDYRPTARHKKFIWLRKAIMGATEEGCLLWPFNLDACSGYAQIRIIDHTYNAHRVALALHQGVEPPEGLHAAHSCKNRHCVNPFHISWKTPAENNSDKLRDGTLARGERVNTAKLRSSQVLEIVLMAKAHSQKEVAAKYGIDPTMVSQILLGKSWGHVTGIFCKRPPVRVNARPAPQNARRNKKVREKYRNDRILGRGRYAGN